MGENEEPGFLAYAEPSASITVVVPTCRRPVLLKRALLSILLQVDAPPTDVVVADGCPSSETRGVVEWFKSVARGVPWIRRVVYVAEWTRGPSQTKNLGLKQVRTRYVTILDDDDMLLPYALRLYVLLSEALRAKILIGHAISTLTCRPAGYTPRGGLIEVVKPRDYYCGLLGGEHAGVLNAEEVEPLLFDERLYASEKTTHLLRLVNAGHAYHVKIPFRVYEQRFVGVTRSKPSRKRLLLALNDYIVHLETHLERYVEHGCLSDLCRHYIERMARTAYTLGFRDVFATALSLHRNLCPLARRLLLLLSLPRFIQEGYTLLRLSRLGKTESRKCDVIALMIKGLVCYKRVRGILEKSGIEKFTKMLSSCMLS